MANTDNPYGFTTFYFGPDDTYSSQFFADLHDLGCTWWRAAYRWVNIEQSPAVYTWTVLDAAVAAANAAGIHLILPIMDAPSWHLTQTCGAGGAPLPGASDTATFAAAVAARYNGTNVQGVIASIEVGNEEYDSKHTCLDATYYVPVLQAAAPAIRTAGFSNKIGCAATLQRDTANLTSWYDTFFNAGCGSLVDYLNFHFYNCPHGPNDGNAFAPTFQRYFQLLRQFSTAHGYPDMDVWCTETGYPTNLHPNYTCMVTEAVRNAYFQLMIDQARQGGVVSHLLFYTIDAHLDGNSITHDYGSNRTYTPAYITLQNHIERYPQWKV